MVPRRSPPTPPWPRRRPPRRACPPSAGWPPRSTTSPTAPSHTRKLDDAGRVCDDRIAALGWAPGTWLTVAFDGVHQATFRKDAARAADPTVRAGDAAAAKPSNRRSHVGSKGLVVAAGIRTRLGVGPGDHVAVAVDASTGTLTVVPSGLLDAGLAALDLLPGLQARLDDLERWLAEPAATAAAPPEAPATTPVSMR